MCCGQADATGLMKGGVPRCLRRGELEGKSCSSFCTPKVHTALESAGALVGLRNSWWLEVLIVFVRSHRTVQSTTNAQRYKLYALTPSASQHAHDYLQKCTHDIVRGVLVGEGSYMYSLFHTRGSTRQWSDSVVRRGSRVVASYVTLLHENFSVCVRKKDCVCDALCRDARSLRRCPSPPTSTVMMRVGRVTQFVRYG